ncbi:hypothetical protein PGB28_14060 [Primorskyibacter aestuariivivens]|uniref:hypothetical protein n=1 Tax=Primorskyibacter aestuariivivens TaxID=1888912 RepID=UPI002300C52D|nr:hypothetical protein [Primorskyibacter aestuariivivens]MDA7429590.1 hypothetical protein [Primorskyibacter aestuariivivens]
MPHDLSAGRSRRVVIVCPGEVVSGGPEALHQLAAALVKSGHTAEMCYFPFDRGYANAPLAYGDYNVPVCTFDQIGDADVVLPEARTGFARLFRPEQVWIWWLSVDHYRGTLREFDKPSGGLGLDPDRHLPLWQMRGMRHLSQSFYATQFLKYNGIEAMPLGDYLVKAHAKRSAAIPGKQRIVLYNPKKGLKLSKSIMEVLTQETFVPIVDLDHDDVARLLEQAALYIDFGPHPGKDRLPREAAMAGCCIVTGLQGAAGNAMDVPIPTRYKIDETARDFPDTACRVIVDVLDHWKERQADFEDYRLRIEAEEENFLKQVAGAFGGRQAGQAV